MIWLPIIIFLVLINVKLAIDLKQFHSRKTINHKVEAVFVAIALTGLSWWVGWKSTPMWFFGWWIFFDFGWNILVGNSLFYIGETAALDKAMRRSPALVWFKYGAFAISIILFIML